MTRPDEWLPVSRLLVRDLQNPAYRPTSHLLLFFCVPGTDCCGNLFAFTFFIGAS